MVKPRKNQLPGDVVRFRDLRTSRRHGALKRTLKWGSGDPGGVSRSAANWLCGQPHLWRDCPHQITLRPSSRALQIRGSDLFARTVFRGFLHPGSSRYLWERWSS